MFEYCFCFFFSFYPSFRLAEQRQPAMNMFGNKCKVTKKRHANFREDSVRQRDRGARKNIVLTLCHARA